MASPTDMPVRSEIRQAAIYGLKTMTPTTGYYFDMKHVFDPPNDMVNIHEYPSVNIFTDDEACANVADVKLEGNEGLLHNQMTLRFDCYLNDINNPALAQDKMLADVQKYFGTNYKIPDSNGDPTCHECYYDSCDPWGTERTVPNCGITVRFKVWYRQKRTNPAAMTG